MYVHQKSPQPLRHFPGCSIPTVPTAYGSIGIVHAELALLSTALQDTRNAKFVLCSGSCVPLKPWSVVYHALTCDDVAHFASFSEPYGRYAGRLGALR